MATPQISLLSKKISCLILLVMIISFHQKLTHAQQPSTNSPSPPPLPSVLGNFIPSTVITTILILCAFFLVTICSIFLRSCVLVSYASETASPYSDYTRSYGLDPTVINTFPIFIYSDVKELKVGKVALECAVCLSEFEDDDMLRLIPKCDHVFHPECIDAWLASHVTCPVCRAMLSEQEEEAKEMIDIDIESRSTHANSSNAISPSQGGDSIINMQMLETPIVMGKFTRSHSTGHSLVKQGDCTERYTLRLSEEMRKQLAVMSVSGKVLKRTRSYDFFILRKASVEEGSSKGGWRSWVASMTPRIIGGGSSGSGAGGGRDGDGSSKGKIFPIRVAV